MKRIICRFEKSENWDEFLDYVLSTYPTDRYVTDYDTDDADVLAFFG